MKRRLSLIVVPVVILIILSSISEAAIRTSVGVTGGAGLPVGWWGERWNPYQFGEINIRYEFMPGIGILLFSGLGKAYLTDLSSRQILEESRIWDIQSEFRDYMDILEASQSGCFKQITAGFGFYMERLLAGFRTYGSAAATLYFWKFERSQDLDVQVTVPDIDYRQVHSDPWIDEQDGADLGAQVALGMLYPVKRNVYVDVSAAYHLVNIGRKYGALAYWGKPARTWSEEERDKARGGADFLQLRVGIRYGR